MMTRSDDYVLGTHSAELQRLGLQHAVWRARALEAWRQAGFSIGQTIIDLGAGPGYATLDLSDTVGPGGKVIAVERSEIFLSHLQSRISERGLHNIETLSIDLANASLPQLDADGAWCRWIFAFLPKPRDTLRDLIGRLKTGAPIVIHEYLDYRTWRLVPQQPLIEAFVDRVLASWRQAGGEPDIGLQLPQWLEEEGCVIEAAITHCDFISPESFAWHWPMGFVEVNARRLADIGQITPSQADDIIALARAASSSRSVRMVTPLLGEIRARKT